MREQRPRPDVERVREALREHDEERAEDERARPDERQGREDSGSDEE